ncbi:GAF domain-containing sensor histidine kinase [Nocardioides sp. Arc9.136]|uniref:sensor histidine kinase n=1 Tax=Nocardioides sp. Arc9.136 TaxID=2996826 RepID=UPI002664FFD7|nr:GAF domain-containing sensor histidine kinase [Nocardioides sp. Arc9.136]WKN49994.1 GAF domain-containing sensor histidine kinase [Nocardioides sp. Arc9.136]
MSVTHETDDVRVAQIGEYQIITRPPRKDLVALVEIAAQVARVPLATINLITDTHQHQIATSGFDASVCAREDSMCNLVLHDPEPVVVEDASLDPRFADNPFVTGQIGDVRFYATHQLRTPKGVVIGTLCVFDTEPRTITAEQEQALRALADRVVDLLELELRTRELSASVGRLEEVQAELKRSNEQLAAFAGQVSHDLRNPLTAVSMALRMLSDELAERDVQRESGLQYLLARAISGSSRMQSLIDDLLAFARLGGELQRRPVDLAVVMREVTEDLSAALEGATLEVEDLPVVTGDAVQLRAVLQNLVANAAKFTRPGEKAHVSVCSYRRGDSWRIEVVDRGIGVPAGQRLRVFQPLARVDDSVEGSGIGLTTCRRIVEAHGGRIGLEESPYGGTTAWFELPA